MYPVPECAEIEILVKTQLNFIVYKVVAPVKSRFLWSGHSNFEAFMDENDKYEQTCMSDHKLIIKHTINNNLSTVDGFYDSL